VSAYAQKTFRMALCCLCCPCVSSGAGKLNL